MTIQLAQNIRTFRKQRALTQEQLAEVLGVTVGAVYKWEAGLSLPELKSRWRVEYKQYADRKLVAELVAVSEIGSRCTLRLFCFWEQRKAPAFARELKCQA